MEKIDVEPAVFGYVRPSWRNTAEAQLQKALLLAWRNKLKTIFGLGLAYASYRGYGLYRTFVSMTGGDGEEEEESTREGEDATTIRALSEYLREVNPKHGVL